MFDFRFVSKIQAPRVIEFHKLYDFDNTLVEIISTQAEYEGNLWSF